MDSMKALAAAVAACLTLLPVVGSAASFEEEILQRHNALRARHGVQPLAWNAQMAAYAQQWAQENARTNTMQHRPNNKYGENIYWVSGGALTGAGVADSWYSEAGKYNYGKPGFSSATGHFTQMVWKSSRALGCGRAQTRSGGTYVVCNYDPPGNYTNQYGANVPQPR